MEAEKMTYSDVKQVTETDFRAILSGVVVATALMLFLSTSVRGFFLSRGGTSIERSDLSVWFTMTAAWAVSLFIGSLVSSSISRTQEMRDGLLQGLIVWAGSLHVLGFVIAAQSPGRSIIPVVDQVSGLLVLRDFFGELFCLVVSILGGFVGTVREPRGFRSRLHASKPN